MMDEQQEIRPGKSDEPRRLVKMAEISVQETELTYVTAISAEHKTFFAQQCRYTNQSLVALNSQIHEYCKKLREGNPGSQQCSPHVVQVGDVFCTRYQLDNNYYRGFVKKCDDVKRECQLYFVDYGNYETVSYNDLVLVSPKDLPAIETAPFGFHCTLKGSEKLEPAETKHLLDCIMEEYILLKANERLDIDRWRVELPKVAYNTTFWISYQKGKNTNKASTDSEVLHAAKVDCA